MQPNVPMDQFYPIALPVTYEGRETEEVSGCGQTLAMSSTRIRFQSDRHLSAGLALRLVMTWPARLPDGTGLNLWMTAKVLRSSSTEVEAQILKHEFRTRRMSQKAPAAAPLRRGTSAGVGA